VFPYASEGTFQALAFAAPEAARAPNNPGATNVERHRHTPGFGLAASTLRSTYLAQTTPPIRMFSTAWIRLPMPGLSDCGRHMSGRAVAVVGGVQITDECFCAGPAKSAAVAA
jgi:hypothetical protein